MKFKYYGEIDIEIDLKEVAGEFLDNHNLSVENNKLIYDGIGIEKAWHFKIIRKALKDEIKSWLEGQNIIVKYIRLNKCHRIIEEVND